MSNTGQVVTLQQGAGPSEGDPQTRRDWTPWAQPPDSITGIMAHTPDPGAYHDAGGRTMIPRATRQYGSQGFSTRAGILHVDPSNPASGAGGLVVDTEQISKEAAAHAAQSSMGQPEVAWNLVANAQNVHAHPAPPDGPPPVEMPYEPGFVVPHATPGGAQIQQPVPPQLQQQAAAMHTPAAAALGGQASVPAVGTVTNPSVKPRGAPMSVPTTISMPPAQVPSQQQWNPAQATAAPEPHPQTPMQQVQPAQGQQQPTYQQPVYQQPPQQQQPVYQQPAYQQPVYQPAQPVQPPAHDPSQAVMAQALEQILSRLAQLERNGSGTRMSPGALRQEREELEEVREKLDRDFASDKSATDLDKSARAEERDYRAEESDDAYVAESTGFWYLTGKPKPPAIPIIFDLGPGGQHYIKFHDVAISGMWLSLIVDTRYDGNQFVPPVTPPEAGPITVTFPKQNRTLHAIVPPDCNKSLHCLDIIELTIVDAADTAQTHPQMAPEIADLAASLMDTGARAQQSEFH